MDMESFYNKCPDIAEGELYCINIKSHNTLKPGQYFFLENYCNESDCDCRRVFINISHNNKILATIGYGWEIQKFYENWFGDKSMKKLIKDLKGPVLEIGGIQTEYSKALLDMFKEVVSKDKKLVDMLKRHYKLFKEKC